MTLAILKHHHSGENTPYVSFLVTLRIRISDNKLKPDLSRSDCGNTYKTQNHSYYDERFVVSILLISTYQHTI